MKTREELALAFANSSDHQEAVCPRQCKNPGLYYGFLAGYDAALILEQAKSLLTPIETNESGEVL